MKKTLLTVALTTVTLLTLVGIISSQTNSGLMFNSVSRADGGYGGGGSGQTEFYAEAPAALPAMDALGAPMEAKNLAVMLEQPAAVSSAADTNRIVIKNADLAVVVKDPSADLEKIKDLAEAMGGYVVSSNMYKTNNGINNISVPEIAITIRVPQDKLDDALKKIKQGAVDVDYENVSSVDVTSEYVDLQSRLKAKQEAEKQLLKIMEKAEKSEDVLAIYMQVQNIQTEIESLKGQIKYYDESSEMSAISVRLIAERGSQPVAVSPWSPFGAWKEALGKLDKFAKAFADFLINLAGFTLPAMILVGLPLAIVYFGGRALVRRFAKSKANVEVKEEGKK